MTKYACTNIDRYFLEIYLQSIYIHQTPLLNNEM